MLLSCEIYNIYYTSILWSTKLPTKLTLRIDELLRSNREKLETLLPISRRDCFIHVSSRSFNFSFKKASCRPSFLIILIGDCSVEITASKTRVALLHSRGRRDLPSTKTDVTTRCRSKGRVDSSPSELINSADASPPPFLSALPSFNRRIRDKSSRPSSPTSACRAFPS